MRISLRFKLLLSYLSLLLLMSASIYGYLNYSLQKSIVGTVRENLASQARMAALMTGRELLHPGSNASQLAAEIGRTLTARVTVIAPDGTVIGDSEVSADRLGELENHLGRPEVQQAIIAGQGTAIRYSATLRTDMLYVAVPFNSNGVRGGIIRIALPLASVEKAISGLHKTLGISLSVAFILALIFSLILSRLTSRPLRQVADIATEIGRGNFHRRLPVEWHDELGDLSSSMNEMANRLEEQLTNLASERNRLDAILSGMGEGLMVTDREGKITLVNPAFCKLFRVYGGLIGNPLSHISRHPALLESYNLVSSDKCQLQNEMTVNTPEEIFLSAHWVPLLNENGMQGVVAVFHDVTDLKRLESIRRDFVANVSHELRTPVTVIKGYSETLLDNLIVENPDKAAEFVKIILSHSVRLASLLNDLLCLSEMESPAFSFQMNPISLESTVRKVCSLLNAKADTKRIVIKTSGLGAISSVMADQGRLEQVLVNLLDNAVKYSPEGGKVSIDAVEENEFICISVKDAGPGIPAQSIPRLFERFYRVDSGRSRNEGGTGLGLAIVKHIVLLHGGTVAAENNADGPGANFSFTLKKGTAAP